MLVVFPRSPSTIDGRPARVAVDADRQAFEDRFYEAIIGTSDTGFPEWTPDATVVWDGTTCAYEGPDPLPDRFTVQIDNLGAEQVALVTGTYAPGTTTADVEAYRASGQTSTPEWWNQQAVIGVLSGAHDVWIVEGGSGITAVCFLEDARFWELAGPRLPD